MTPRLLGADDPLLPAVLTLIRQSFAFMDAVIDPPSSMHLLTLESLRAQTETGEIWALPQACVILNPRPDTLYLGKLAVAPAFRGKGLARALVSHAISRARALHRPTLTLQARIELTGNQALFTHLGFAEIARTAHPGFSRPTSITYRLTV